MPGTVDAFGVRARLRGQKRSPTSSSLLAQSALACSGSRADAGAHRAYRPVDHLRHLAVLAGAAAGLFGRGDEGGQHSGRGSLLYRVELEGRPVFGRQLGVDPRHGRLERAELQMAVEAFQ